MLRWPRAYGMWLLIAALGLLLGLLAALQYQWTGEIGRAEAERQRVRLQRSAQRFALELGREVMRVMLAFRPEMPRGADDPRAFYRNRLQAWRRGSEHADLVSRVVLVARPDSGPLVAEASTGEDRGFAPIPFPPELKKLRRQLESIEAGRVLRGAFRPDWLLEEPLALTLPMIETALRGPARFGPEAFRPRGIVVVELSLDYLREELFPQLAEIHFGPLEGGDYAVAVRRSRDGAILYSSDPALGPEDLESGDVTLSLLDMQGRGGAPGDRFERGAFLGAGRPGERRFPPEPWRDRGPDEQPPEPRFDRGPPPAPGERDGPWILVVRHHGGSLAKAVEGVRRRNLAVGLGVLALLGTAALLLAAGGQRARNLARQQLEFVAGVTHELNTPLAAIRSAGQNLADGVVSEPPQVRRYGELIEKESGRLTTLVAQVLDFAGIESGGRAYKSDPVPPGPLVQKVVADLGLVIEQAGLEVQTDITPDLPDIKGDATALRRALENLLTNAVKFAAAGGWVAVRVSRQTGERPIVLRVEDRGPGIPRAERGRVFEPFYRGLAAQQRHTPGSGLGLSLVRHVVGAHGGRVRVEPREGGGTAVVMELPIADDEAKEKR